MIVFTAFAFSYILRFVYNTIITNLYEDNNFLLYIFIDAVCLFEGVSMGTLLLLHYLNFKPDQNRSLSENDISSD